MTKRLLLAYGCSVALLSACGEGAPPPDSGDAVPPYWVFDSNGQPLNSTVGGVGDVAEDLASPTGQLGADNAIAVAEEFETAGGLDSSLGDLGAGFTAQSASGQLLGGVVRKGREVPLDSAEICPAGGSVSATGRQSGDVVTANGRYDNCCVDVGCCISGSFTSQVSGAADFEAAVENGEAAGSFEVCTSGSLQISCGQPGGTESVDFAFCLGDSGIVYLIEVQGESFAVSGTYANGNGELTIRGANGVWQCQFEGGAGACTGESGSFQF